MFHRGHEHGGRMGHLVAELSLSHCDFFAWDARGLGRSAGERGHAESFGSMVQDIDCFIRHICQHHDLKPQDIVVLGQSVGAVMLTTWVHDYAPDIRAMILAAPAFKVKLYVPFARQMIALRQKISGVFTVNSYVKAHYLSHDPKRIESYNNDPLITRPIASNILLDLYQAAERCITDAHTITTPTLTLVSGSDWVVEKAPQYEFMARLGSRDKQLIELPGFFHDTLGELHREQALKEIRRFINNSFAATEDNPDLKQADKQGQGYQNFQSLKQPVTGIQRYYWDLLKQMTKLGAKFSEGYKLGQTTGFDSGSTLDYVYQNQPQGKGWLGRIIDNSYLNSIGWRGIRQRKTNLEQLINQAINQLQQNNLPIHIADIAAGQGRYILDAIEPRKTEIESLLLRDFSDINVTAGNQALQQRGFDGFSEFQQGDAFDQASVAAIEPKPTLGIVSGLYELFSDNNMIRRSLAGLAQAIKSNGYLIYTNQPWHPQQELIARVLTSHQDGQQWVMRCRSQREMDQLIEEAGFEKCGQLIDQWGIFSVSIARRK
ncbi:hypothetical protein GCM10007941_15340 [Amphritea balenae]|nr:hypothetical protein GCM10007941_15340 [Amphritea balenae]